MSANLENTAAATGLEKVSFHSNPKEKQCQRMTELLHSCTHLTPSNTMFKILQAKFQQYVNQELSDMFKLDLEKTEESEVKLPTSIGSSKKQENSRETFTSALLTMLKPLTMWITANCGKFLKR